MLSWVVGFALWSAEAHIPETYIVYPSDDWCSLIQAGYTGDLYLFQPGVYMGPCEITGPAPDQYGERLYLESFYPQDGLRAVFRGDGVADHIFLVRGYDVSLNQLEFDQGTADAVHIEGNGHYLWQLVTTSDFQGAAVRQVGDLSAYTIDECSLDGTGPVSIALGCPGCTSDDAWVIENRIETPGTAILGTDGAEVRIRKNAIQADVGIEWHAGVATSSWIEKSLVIGGTTGVRVVGGDAVVRNNVILASERALVSEGPGTHGIYGNSLHVPVGDAVSASWSGAGFEYRNNAQVGAEPAGGVADGNVGCDPAACDCWIDPEQLDFYPVPGGPLVGAAVDLPFGQLDGDFCDAPRSMATAGAFESLSVLGPGPLAIESPTEWDCTLPEDPEIGDPDYPCPVATTPGASTGTSGSADSGQPASTGAGRSGGCGCSASLPSSAGLWGTALVLLFAGRRRQI